MNQNSTGKPVSASAVTDQVYWVFPNDLNANDTVFGGMIMAQMDRLTDGLLSYARLDAEDQLAQSQARTAG